MQPVRPASPRAVNCPRCGKPVEWVAENRYRPFCSARCKGADLGAWASDSYRIEATEEPHPEDPSE
ncbi:DNA gyrase inhibitor YacG [Sulfuritalea sp.]|uniref:DNA gyrase inhibitor YacG n=1 Tax=Sulfuritalea sp. TaxID=2480090 RepID=UPI00286E1594|nr:DNA gyrase inhibitor YacG [Sulfuritalea sp.]